MVIKSGQFPIFVTKLIFEIIEFIKMKILALAITDIGQISANSVFTETPSANKLMTVGIIVGVSILLGIFTKRVLFVWLQKIASKTTWKGDDILIDSSKNVIELFFFLSGIYFSIFYLPFTEKWSNLVLKFSEVSFVLLVTVYVARISTRAIRSYQETQEGKVQSTSIFSIVVKTIVYVLGGLIVLQAMGISITPLLTALGVGGLAVALALQDTLSNLFAGLQILAAKNIQVGNYIQLESLDEGYVEDINWRSTTIRALPNRLIIIPNSKLAASTVKNFSKPDLELSVPIEVGVSYTSDLEKVEKVAREVALSIQQSVEGAVPNWEPGVRFHTFGTSSVNLTVVLRASEFTTQFNLKSLFIKALHKRFVEEGIEIPFPITTVHLKKEV
jgi:small-conductance mechanosensitive channel